MGNQFQNSTDEKLLSLLEQVQGGSQTAFEELLDRYAPLIESMAVRFHSGCTTVHDREDFRQEAVIGFYRAAMRFDMMQEKVQFGLYAKECVKNALISYLRKLKRYENVVFLEDEILSDDTEDLEGDPAKHLVEEENYLELSRCIHNYLSKYENRIWWLYLSGRTAREIAAFLGKDERSIQNAVYRIRRKLRAVIPNPSETPE